MVDNFVNDKDIYSTLISTALGKSYDECTKEGYARSIKEWEEGGRVGPHPTNYRDQGKTLQLALSYGLGPGALSESLNMTLDEAKQLMADFRENLNVAFGFERNLKKFVKQHGYLKTIWGNKRRFPNYALPEIQVRMADGSPLPTHVYNTVTNSFRGVWRYNDRRDLKNRLETQYQVIIEDNKEKIQEDETRILNSLIQGSGAGMTKMALLMIYNDKLLNDLGAFPVLLIHDEIILECPKENAEEVGARFSYLMEQAAYVHVKTVPFKSSVEVMDRWLAED